MKTESPISRSRTIVHAFMLSILILSFTAINNCGSSEDEGLVTILMIDNAFNPPMTRIPEGGKLRFANRGNSPHNAFSLDKSWNTEKAFGNISMMPGDFVDIDFPEEGVYPYYCTFHATPDGKSGMVGTVVVGNMEYNANDNSSGKYEPVEDWSGVTRKVPQNYPTIQNAVDASKPGDLVLVDEGVYKEQVVVTTPSLVIRGTNRNKVIIDGEFQRGNGILVVQADGVTIENMTARNHTLNGFYWTGVKGYRGSYLTAYNNGDYGIYAFGSTEGVIEYSYASGSPDAGIYIGQCYPCNSVVDYSIAENNALGYSGTNSGGDLYILRSVWKDNFGGIVPNTLDTELLPPQREATIMGNLVLNNNNIKASSIPLAYTVYGNGILLGGVLRNRVEKNLVLNSKNHGILVIPNLDDHFWLSHDNEIRNNIVLGSGRSDLALSGPFSLGNCFENNIHFSSLPSNLESLQGCSGIRYPLGGDLTPVFGEMAMMLDKAFPHGDWKTQPTPPPQSEMPAERKKEIRPALHAFAEYDLDLDSINIPKETSELLKETKLEGTKIVGSFSPIQPDWFSGALLIFLGLFLPFAIYASWSGTAVLSVTESKELSKNGKLGYLLAILFLPFAGALLYHLREGIFPKSIRIVLFVAGPLLFLVYAIYLVLMLL